MKKLQLPDIPESEKTPFVTGLHNLAQQLIEHCAHQQEQIDELKDEVRVLKGQKKRPKFKPSKLDKTTSEEDSDKKSTDQKKNSRGNNTRPVGRTVRVKPDDVPAGSTLHSVREFKVQALRINSEHICYELERWKTPEGKVITAKPPTLGHFDHNLVSYVLYQHHHCQVTQPLLLEQLREWGVHISSGQLNNILLKNKKAFHHEKDELLKTALQHAEYITVDDSGARHQGKNGYVTHMGNEWFAWFSSMPSKSRVNFLSLLCGGDVQYRLCPEALDYMRAHKLPQSALTALENSSAMAFFEQDKWLTYLKERNIKTEHHVRIATEGALMGHLLYQGDIGDLPIISDGAGQFAVFEHGLCWVHTERLFRNLLPSGNKHREEVNHVISQIWDFYRSLRNYKASPTEAKAKALSDEFDKIFSQETEYIQLGRKLKKILKKKDKLLLVLTRPEVPLHTNGSETDIRDYVKKRKVSGGTRSDEGKQCRDTFISLKKTCRKLGISFWAYLQDRLTVNITPPLHEIMHQKMTGNQPATSY